MEKKWIAPKSTRLQRGKLIIVKHYIQLSWILYVFGIFWIFLFPRISISTGELKCRGTYFSENALLMYSSVPQITPEYVRKVQPLQKRYLQSEDKVAFLKQRLEDIHCQVSTQQFNDTNGNVKTNVIGILKASPFSDGKESIVIAANYLQTSTISSVSIYLVLLEYLAQVKWLAKDIIVLFAGDEPFHVQKQALGVHHWLTSYHESPLKTMDIIKHAGVIRGALVLDLESISDINAMSILSSGRNGQSPNLDLVNAAVYTMQKQQLNVYLDKCEADLINEHCDQTFRPMLHYLVDSFKDLQWKEYLNDFYRMLTFMKSIAIGPNGPHAEFISYNIDSITLQGAKTMANVNNVPSSRSILRSVEKIVRAMSSIEEKLHQSYYFYILPNTSTFVSIGEYYYTIVLTSMPCLLILLFAMYQAAGIRTGFGLTAFIVAEIAGLILLLTNSTWLGVASVLQILIACVIVPFLDRLPIFSGNTNEYAQITKLMEEYEQHQNDVARIKHDIILETSDEMKARLAIDGLYQEPGWVSLKCAAMALLVYANCILGCFNFPFALGASILSAPFSLITPRTKSISSIVQAIILCMTSPLVWSFFIDLPQLIVDYENRSSIMYPYFCLVYFPAHTLLWCIYLRL